MSKKNSYDYVVVGSNLCSVLLAQKASQRGFSVALVPNKESLEDFRSDRSQTASTSHEPFLFMGLNEQNEKLINWLEDEFFAASGLEYFIQDSQPITFESGEFKPFLGFGERKLSTIDELAEYIAPQRILIETREQHWIQSLLNNPSFEILEKTAVTEFIFDEGKLVGLTLNGKKQIKAENVIYTHDPKQLLELLTDDHLATREKQKLAKSKLWTRLNISFTFSSDADYRPGLHVLIGTKDDFEPVIGEFYLGEDGITSHWSYLVNAEVAETAEGLASVIKYIKRQIKRAYPELLTLEHTERINVFSNTHGNINNWEATTLKGINNLYLGSPQFSELSGLGSGIQMAKKISEELFGSTPYLEEAEGPTLTDSELA